ncbi:MAG: RNA-binding cell elongation regulator Jag/EloR [Candidatus Promineifilaceae bacterium]
MTQQQQTIEEQAPTVEEAINAGLARLRLPRERVEIEIVDEGRRGLLGIGGRSAVVRLRTLPKPPPTPKEPAPAPEPEPALEAEPAKAAPTTQEPAASTKPATKAKPARTVAEAVEPDAREAEVALSVVKQLLEKMQIDAVVTASTSEPDDLTRRQITMLNITGDDLGLLIGARGETLDAMQHLARLMVAHEIRGRANFVIDVEGYRARREQALARLAERMGQKAIDRGQPVTLEAMPAYERRIIHMTLRENPQVRTESTGEGDRRRVRIYPL